MHTCQRPSQSSCGYGVLFFVTVKRRIRGFIGLSSSFFMSTMPLAALQFMFDCPLQSHTWPMRMSSTFRTAFLLVAKVIERGSAEAAGVVSSTLQAVSYPTLTVTASPHEGVTVSVALGSAQPCSLTVVFS